MTPQQKSELFVIAVFAIVVIGMILLSGLANLAQGSYSKNPQVQKDLKQLGAVSYTSAIKPLEIIIVAVIIAVCIYIAGQPAGDYVHEFAGQTIKITVPDHSTGGSQ